MFQETLNQGRYKMDKEFYKSKTFWGALFAAIGLLAEPLGFVTTLTDVALAIGIPLTAFGIRDAL